MPLCRRYLFYSNINLMHSHIQCAFWHPAPLCAGDDHNSRRLTDSAPTKKKRLGQRAARTHRYCTRETGELEEGPAGRRRGTKIRTPVRQLPFLDQIGTKFGPRTKKSLKIDPVKPNFFFQGFGGFWGESVEVGWERRRRGECSRQVEWVRRVAIGRGGLNIVLLVLGQRCLCVYHHHSK